MKWCVVPRPRESACDEVPDSNKTSPSGSRQVPGFLDEHVPAAEQPELRGFVILALITPKESHCTIHSQQRKLVNPCELPGRVVTGRARFNSCALPFAVDAREVNVVVNTGAPRDEKVFSIPDQW